MKQLTQAIFKDAPDWVNSFAVDSNGELHAYAVEKKYLSSCHLYHHAPLGSYSEFYDDGYDASDWENSAIEKEVAK